MMTAPPEYCVAPGQLAANAVAGIDPLGIEPIPEHNGALVDAISNHDGVNVGRSRGLGKTDFGVEARFSTSHSPMIFKTTRFGLPPSHSP
jgi:hypothetical protein